MNREINIENRLNHLEKELRRINRKSDKKQKWPKLLLTTAIVLERIWRLIKHFWLEASP